MVTPKMTIETNNIRTTENNVSTSNNSTSTTTTISKTKNSNYKLQTTYREFIQALYSLHDDFDSLYWLYRLGHAIVFDGWTWFGTFIRLQSIVWRPFVPLFGLSLILFVSLSYFFAVREYIMEYYYQHNNDNQHFQQQQSYPLIRPLYVHDIWIVYVSCMIVLYYYKTMMDSPGVYLNPSILSSENKPQKNNFYWSAWNSQGGMLWWKIPIQMHEEQLRVHLYDTSNNSNDDSIIKGCISCSHTKRPMRCHHCKVCNRCILQYDHHCLWLNNCIGYNNYRSFVMLLIYMTAGCMYGIYRLLPIIITIHTTTHGMDDETQPQQEQLSLFTIWTTILFHLPSFGDLFSNRNNKSNDISLSSLPVRLIQLIFPLLILVGTVMVMYLWIHIRYILSALTSLEHLIYTEQLLADAMVQVQLQQHRTDSHRPQQLEELNETIQNNKDSENNIKTPTTATTTTTITTETQIHNPFDQGIYKNWIQIMGNDWFLLLFLPPVSLFKTKNIPPPPYIPPPEKLLVWLQSQQLHHQQRQLSKSSHQKIT